MLLSGYLHDLIGSRGNLRLRKILPRLLCTIKNKILNLS